MASTTSSAVSDEEEEQEQFIFPKSIKEFGYKFNEKGELRNIETDERFNFTAKRDDPRGDMKKFEQTGDVHYLTNFEERKTSHRYNQKRYEALGETITDYVYDLLEKETKLKRYYIPEDAEDDEPKSFIFMSDDALTNEDKLLLIIHGSGVVRAGQWSRKLIINNDLEKGTQLQYIKAGIEQGYGIIVFNTNLNKVTLNGEDIFIRDNETPEDHGIYVWKNFVRNAKAKNVAIVAHSYGGIVTVEMAKEFPEEFDKRVFGIGFTDSVHSLTHQLEDDKSLLQFFKQKAVNYVSCTDKLGEPVDSFEAEDCPRLSAGTDQHELTSWSCFNLLMKFLEEKYTLINGTDAKSTEEEATAESTKPAAQKSESTEEEATAESTKPAAQKSESTEEEATAESTKPAAQKSEPSKPVPPKSEL